jgi:hypothetical protein
MSDLGPIILHPAQYFDPRRGLASVGIVDEKRQSHLIIVNRDAPPVRQDARQLFREGRAFPEPYAFAPLANRWDPASVDAFLRTPTGPDLWKILTAVRRTLLRHIEFSRPEDASLVACWVVGTYFYTLFPAFPRLNVMGERGSGKSKVLRLIALVAFNGLLRLTPTLAALFRLIDPLRPTFCLDEMEGLATGDRLAILALINSGYQAGGAVDRVEGEGDHRRVTSYQVYAPMALGGIAGLNATTADRSITLVMHRGQHDATVNRSLDLEHGDFRLLRAACYGLALRRFREIRQAWDTLDPPPWLKARPRELYGPLLTIATLAEQEGDPSFLHDLLALAEAERGERGGASPDTEVLLQLLVTRLNAWPAPSLEIRPGALVDEMHELLGGTAARPVTAEQVGRLLQRLGFPRKRVSLGSVYAVSRDQLTAVCVQLGYEPPTFSPLSNPGQPAPDDVEIDPALLPGANRA